MTVRKIVSGGETGAERAGLDWAVSNSLPHDGWCAKGRKALDGPLEDCYLLKETPFSSGAQGDLWNVRDSDATLIFTLAGKATGAAGSIIRLAEEAGRPYVHIHEGTSLETVRTFLRRHQPQTLNVTGSCEEKEPGIYLRTRAFLDRLWKAAAPPP